MKKSMIASVFLLLLMVAVLTITATAAEIVDSGYCGGEGDGSNLTWTLDSEGTLTISGTGTMANRYSQMPWHTRHHNEYRIRSVVIEEGVTNICSWAFHHCDKMVSISIPLSCDTIEDYAFYACGLVNVVIPDSVVQIGAYAFALSSSLTDITISDSVLSIGKSAFDNCCRLVSVKLPKGIAELEDNMFLGCSDLANVEIPRNIKRIGNHVFAACSSLGKIAIPENVDFIGNSIFSNCTSLTSVELPNAITDIPERTFYNCHNLAGISIPNSVSSIGSEAFRGCESLMDVIIPYGVKTIAPLAFHGCINMVSMTIPVTVSKIGSYATIGCNCLKDVYYAGSLECWEHIEIEHSNYGLNSAVIHYHSYGANISVFDGLLQTDASIYNDELALIAANLALKTYDNGGANDESVRGYLTYDLGFDSTTFYTRNYGNPLAFTIAQRPYTGADADEVLVIVAQGSTNAYELIKDATALPSGNYAELGGHYPVYDIVGDFSTGIQIVLNGIVRPGKHYKVLLTGHSLGGAAVNLSAASLINSSGKNDTQFDVFCYTFGAINAINSDCPIAHGYENIHNVYNYMDTFSPYQCGIFLPSGMGRGYGKFGKMETFVYEKRNLLQTGLLPLAQIALHINHDMSNYVEAIEKGIVLNSKSRVRANCVCACPVDFDVYCENELVGRVLNGVVDTSVTTIDITVEGDVKFIIYPDNRRYELKLSAYDEGTMTFSVQNPASPEQVKLITDIALTNGKQMTSETGNEVKASETQVFVTDTDGAVISKVQADGRETAVDSSSMAFSCSEAMMVGNTVRVSGIIENFTSKEEHCMVCAALYQNGKMLDLQIDSIVDVPVKHEVRNSFELVCPAEYTEEWNSLSVKVFYLDPDTLSPLSMAIG